ncbi:MAG: hypothetical protein FD149_2565 [Rhodospirillaceae bacterium]|nr:MAG: hypothetical protein FD149_2565 [Rhodospirillaceae bacterium]
MVPAVAFDTLRFSETLVTGGFTPLQAKAIAQAFTDATGQELATKNDIAAVKNDITAIRAEFKVEIARLETVIKADGQRLEAATKSDIAALGNEFKANITALRVEFKADIARLEVSTKNEIAALRGESKADIAQLENSITALRSESKADIAQLEAGMKAMELRLVIKLGAMLTALIALTGSVVGP